MTAGTLAAPTRSADNTEHVAMNTRQEALEQRVLLLCPTMGWWKGMYQLPNQSTEVVSDGHTINSDDVTTPRAKLMTDAYPLDQAGTPWKKRFQKLESRLGSLKEEYSVPFPITGVRIVPKSRGQELLDRLYGLTLGQLRRQLIEARQSDRSAAMELERQIDQIEQDAELNHERVHDSTPVYDPSKQVQSIAYELYEASREFCRNWSTIRSEIASRNEVFQRVASRVPERPSDMRSRFYLDVVPVELAGGVDSRTVTQEDLAQHRQLVQDACRRRVDEAIEEMVRGPRRQLAEALAGLQGLIARDGRVTSKSFAPVRAAIAKLRSFSFVADEQLLGQLSSLERQLNITNPGSLDSTTAANSGFAAALESAMHDIQDARRQATDMDEFGRGTRAITLD